MLLAGDIRRKNMCVRPYFWIKLADDNEILHLTIHGIFWIIRANLHSNEIAFCIDQFPINDGIAQRRSAKVRDVVAQIMQDGKVDYVDMSLWDSSKFPEDEDFICCRCRCLY